MTISHRPSLHHTVCCALNHVAVAAVAFAQMRAVSVPSVCDTPPCPTLRKSCCGRHFASAPPSSRTPSMNAQRVTCATSASGAAQSAITFAESWVSAVLARTATSQFCSAISWTWRCSKTTLCGRSSYLVRPVAASFAGTPRIGGVFRTGLIHSLARIGVDMPLCSRRTWITLRVTHMAHARSDDDGATLAVSQKNRFPQNELRVADPRSDPQLLPRGHSKRQL